MDAQFVGQNALRLRDAVKTLYSGSVVLEEAEQVKEGLAGAMSHQQIEGTVKNVTWYRGDWLSSSRHQIDLAGLTPDGLVKLNAAATSGRF